MISYEDITHLKDLARVDLGEEETKHLARDLDSILDYFVTLKEVNTDAVQEMTRAFDTQNTVRIDESLELTEKNIEETQSIIKAFPEAEGSYLKVKAIF